MQIAADAPRTQATVQSILVSLPKPFAAGHVCTGPEAEVLNQTLVENVRNNMASKVEEAVKKAREASKTPDEIKAEVQAMIDAYLPEYDFGARKGGGVRITDPVEREAYEIAERIVKDAIKATGTPIKAYEDKLPNMIARALEANPNIREEAAAIVERRRRTSTTVLDLAALSAAPSAPEQPSQDGEPSTEGAV